MDGNSRENAPVATYDDTRPTISDLHGNDPFAQAARRLWLDKKSPKFKPEVIKNEFYDSLERDGFKYKRLLLLENLQFLEKFLWPNFTEDASYYHITLIALIVNVKRREGLPIWDVFTNSPERFSALFHEILVMAQDATHSWTIRSQILGFLIAAFESLDSALVRKECAPLVSISIWSHLSGEHIREARFEKYPHTRKAWRAASKRYNASDDQIKKKLEFDRDWLHNMLAAFVNAIYDTALKPKDAGECLLFCEHFLELLTDLESQLPTRRYVGFLLRDLHITSVIKLSPMYENKSNALFRELFKLFDHFVHFSIDDHTGAQLTQEEARQLHCAALARLQRAALKHFKDKLTILALSNYGLIGQRNELQAHLNTLTDEELAKLCTLLGLRTTYPKEYSIKVGRSLLTEVLLASHEKRATYEDEIAELSILPDEVSLFQSALHGDDKYDGHRPIPVPKLNLQYLTVGDFIWRSFVLYRSENFFGIRRDIEDALQRLAPKLVYPKMETQFTGMSHMALVMSKPSILEVAPAKVGEIHPAFVRAELNLNLTNQPDRVRREWEGLGPGDVVFLLSVKGVDTLSKTNGESNLLGKYGVKHLRSAEVVQVLDQDGRPLNSPARLAELEEHDESPNARNRRRLHVKIDPVKYHSDSENVKSGKPDIYETLNVVVRRKGIENNFKPILESIQGLGQSDVPLPSWLHEVFLGYGDPSSASYKSLKNSPKTMDFRDTFLDWDHLQSSFPEREIASSTGEQIAPPYVIEGLVNTEPVPASAKSVKKRRRGQDHEMADASSNRLLVSTYKVPNMGPYPIDKPRQNQVRFTPAQVEAIASGMNPGLTIIVGPPGTGKTDVVTQIISNIYHNFPKQRTLLIAHSNQALNQLFQKIAAVDIDERHLLRLGHGEDQLATKGSYSKQGRVESFLDNRSRLLAEVDRLAASMNAPGAHGDSCETAGYFDLVYIKPAWARFQDTLTTSANDVEAVIRAFPFHTYFSNTPSPLFPKDVSIENATDIALGAYRHIRKILDQLKDIHPFELLRTARDRQNYLLAREARIVAMTSTHAAMRKREIAEAGFHYDNLIMEEAAQITEIETFIPMALQDKRDERRHVLERVVLVGDHYQNTPVVQNAALRLFSHLDQSMFARMIRLGVPAITLNKQGRARPEIAALYSWRYNELGDLDILSQSPEFHTANAGFANEFQFINVEDYKGIGEQMPREHFIQNLGEAEYAVAIYQYMRLLGYPASKITILATYVGQKALIRDVLDVRCAKNPLFGMPGAINTVDKYQGEQNDYVILSLVRTNRIGYLRDIRRITVALSRARLGLYVLGRRSVFESCFELSEFVKRLITGKSDKLELLTGELWPSKRKPGEKGDLQLATMEGVEHIGQYVYEMAQTKLESLKEERRRMVNGRQ